MNRANWTNEQREEDRRVRRLQRWVDFALAMIAQSDLSLSQARQLVGAVRAKSHELFPDKKEMFELIYTPRFRRLLAEKYNLQ